MRPAFCSVAEAFRNMWSATSRTSVLLHPRRSSTNRSSWAASSVSMRKVTCFVFRFAAIAAQIIAPGPLVGCTHFDVQRHSIAVYSRCADEALVDSSEHEHDPRRGAAVAPVEVATRLLSESA